MGSTIWRTYSREVDRSAVDLLRLARIAGKYFAASWNATSGVKKRPPRGAFVPRQPPTRLSSTALTRMFASSTIISAGVLFILAAHLLEFSDQFLFVNVRQQLR